MRNLLRDVRLGARMFRKNIGFTCAAVTVLALGIGANSAIFSLVNAFLFKPLMINAPSALVGCYSRDTHKSEYRAFSYADYTQLRDQNGDGSGDGVFSNLLAHNLAMVGLSEGNGDSTRRVFADDGLLELFRHVRRATVARPRLHRGRRARWRRCACSRSSATRTGKNPAPVRAFLARAFKSTGGSTPSSAWRRRDSPAPRR